MGFDKKAYWKMRKQKKDGKWKDSNPAKVYPKGEPVFFINGKGERKELPNALGSHRTFSPRGRLIILNRKESRRRVIDRSFTAKGYRNGVKI